MMPSMSSQVVSDNLLSIEKVTPRVPLMKLKCIRGHSILPPAIVKQPFTKLNSSQSLTHINKVQFEKPKMVQIDLPCEPEDEEDWKKEVRSDDNPTEIHTHNQGGDVSKTEKEKGIVSLIKSSNRKDLNNGAKEGNHKKILKAQKNLMQALFESETCPYCKRLISYDADSFKNSCRHTFHSICVKNIEECTNCGKRIEKSIDK